MKTIPEGQTRHQILINLLATLPEYQIDGNPRLKIVKDFVTYDKAKNIESNDIVAAVTLLVDALNLYGGSMGNIDIYELLKAYLTIPTCRDRVNEVVREANRNNI